MAWTSWSQTWSTKNTTTTSRSPLRRSRKKWRWKRMYLLLQADQSLKQYHEDLPLLAHLQELYQFVKKWTDIEPGTQSNLAYPVAKRLNTLLRHGQLRREEDGAIKFLENKILSSERFWELLALVWCNVEEQDGRGLRQQEKISVLYWFLRRKSLPPSSSRSFRTQSYWSFIRGQCFDSGRFPQVHLSRWMCNQFTFHQQFRIDTRRPVFEQKTDSILSACESYGSRTQRSWDNRPGGTASCTVHAYKVEESSKHDVLGRHQTCSKERIEVLSDAIERHHPSQYTPNLLYPEGYSDGSWRNHIRKSFWITSTASEDFLEKWLDEGIGFRSCSTNRRLPTNPTKPATCCDRTNVPSAQEIDTRFSLGCEKTKLFVERLEKDKDTDKDVDADRERTEGPVGGHWSPQLEEIDIDFRVSGLSHAVVKQAENSRVRELVKKIESHPHRQDLQADLQQSNANKPIKWKIKVDDSGHGQCRAIWVMRDNS